MTSSAIIKAIPTEYSGVRFRSKSEAQFAKLMNLSDNHWEYEPDWLEEPPDFVVPMIWTNRLFIRCIEYKPVDATETYQQNLVQRARSWRASIPCDMSAELVVGSVFNGTWKFYRLRNDSIWEEHCGQGIINLGHQEIVRSYRFDLKHDA